jgi:hypothetical protein
MTDIEAKALALLNEVRREYPIGTEYTARHIALCRAIEQHEAFKQEVSDIASAYNKMAFTVSEMEPHLSNYRVIIGFDKSADASMCHDRLLSLLDFLNPKPKPDPLVDVAKSLGVHKPAAQHWAGDVRAALDALGFEIREKGQ